MAGFYRHVLDAIRVNKQRRPNYEARAGRIARRASDLLIRTEYACLPFALVFDRRGKRFNEVGIPIVRGDFVSMDAIGNPDDPPTYTNRAGRGDVEAVRAELDEYRQCLKHSARHFDFEQAARDTAQTLTTVAERETRCGAHFVMVRHLLESIGFAAVNAIRFAELSAGKTLLLSRDLLMFETRGLRTAVALDRRAQAVHALGVGIIVNDLPPIPFPAHQDRHQDVDGTPAVGERGDPGHGAGLPIRRA